MPLNPQKKSLKKKRKDARRLAQPSTLSIDVSSQAIRAANIVSGKPGNLSGRVSKAFDSGEYDEVFSLLFAMRHLGQIPKLGTVQRWVASLGDNTTEDPVALGLLYHILRVASGLGVKLDKTNQLDSLEGSVINSGNGNNGNINEPSYETLLEMFTSMKTEGSLKCVDEWSAVALLNNKTSDSSPTLDDNNINFKESFSLLTTIEGLKRTPPNKHDLGIYECIPNAMGFHKTNLFNKVIKNNVPFVPGAFTLSSLLTPKECMNIIQASEEIGYVPDEPISRSTALVASTSAGLDDRAANFTWLADELLIKSIMDRCFHLFPSKLNDGSSFIGMNARWRLYRYYPGSIYRPHVDGAWPQSGKNEFNQYQYDISNGKIRSRFTFLIYLNEGFKGGHTTYFTPNINHEGEIFAHKVAPRIGSALCFPHGENAGSLVHEGSNLIAGTKYVLRTDALYTIPQRDNSREQQPVVSTQNKKSKHK